VSRVLDTPRPPAAPEADAGEAQRLPHLRLVDRHEPQPTDAAPPLGAPQRRLSRSPSPRSLAPGEASGERAACVLVVGADARARERMLEELRSLLPQGTPFAQAEATWEAIERAAESSMVVLAGDPSDVSASSLMRALARRNPTLPVLSVGEDRRSRRAPPRPAAGAQRGACQAVDTLGA
jgi:hypothetical protein